MPAQEKHLWCSVRCRRRLPKDTEVSPEDFRRYGHQLIDWLADYRESLASRPVMATTRPHPRACIAGTAALHIATTDIRLRSMASTR